MTADLMPVTESSSGMVLRLGARGSLLSRMQAAVVARALEVAVPRLKVQIVTVTTTGDRVLDRPLHELGGKGLFTKEIELAILRGEVDFAVHSYKDVPVTMPLVETADLVIAAVPPREDVRDVLACGPGARGARSIAALPAGARVGTGSLRRGAQILAQRPDVSVLPLRGNVDTRLRKLKSGEYDAVILACAGLRRAGLLESESMAAISIEEMVPAAGQGALALQCRRDAGKVRQILVKLHDPTTAIEVSLEREVVRRLGGDCHSPIAALARVAMSREVGLIAAVGARDGRPPVLRAQALAGEDHASDVVNGVVESLLAQGAVTLLNKP
jgi:hydroxymethylbilane synthase